MNESNHSLKSEGSLRRSFQREDRVPVALQAVFLASNRGKEVHQPPPNSLANKLFRRKSLWQKIQSPIRSPLRRSKASTKLPSPEESIPPPPPPPPLSPETPRHQISPQAYLSSTVLARGYSNKEFPALETAYFNEPSPYQKASYGGHFVRLVRENNIHALRKLLQAGVSANASNNHGETVLHQVCKSGKADCFRLLMNYGGNVQVVDSCGRLPLHNACWASEPSFDIIEMILDEDPRMLFITDSRGGTPLSYVPREKWTLFTRFFMAKKDKYWPDRDFEALGSEKPPELALAPPNSNPIPNRRPDLPLKIIAGIADGSLPPMGPSDSLKSTGSMSSTQLMSDSSDSDDMDDDEEYMELDDDGSSDSDDETEGEEDSSSAYSIDSFDEDEMENILNSIGANIPVQWCK